MVLFMSKRFVVIGASAASIAFITKLRSFDKDSEIICISGEAELPYNRCFLADFVSQDKSLDDMKLKPHDFFEKNVIDLRLGTWVTALDTDANRVMIGNEELSYDYLFLGVGSRAFIPNIGVDFDGQEFGAQGVFAFHTADDVKKLTAYVDKHQPLNAIVIGAGLNGVECVSALQQRGLAVGLVERSKKVLPLQLDEKGSDWLVKVMQNKGVGLFLGHNVAQLCTVNGQVRGVRLESGAELLTNCVVLATGSQVNNDLLHGTNITTEKGAIVVDQSMKTNIDNIFAAGDICIVKDSVSGKMVQSTTWADAMLQGLCAATQLSERPRQYPGFIGLRDSSFFGYDFYGCGKTIGHDSSVQAIHRYDESGFKVFYLHEDCLVGFVLLGDISRVAEYKRLYLTKQSVTQDDLV